MAWIHRISNLADRPLIHILSFLKAKAVVQSSLLSKRYQNLWASVPVLDLDFNEFLSRPNVSSEERDACQDKFVRLINGILEHRNPTDLEAFKLKWEYDSDPTPAMEWLEHVVKFNPKVIHFDVFIEGYSGLTLDVPDSVFVCESLIDMMINLQLINYEVIEPFSVNLPRLKRLTFSLVSMIDETMKKLMSGCPNVEELVLANCDFSISQIISGLLKRLALDSCKQEYDYENPVVLISTPRLEYLEITSFYMGPMNFDKMPSLERAFVRFGGLIIDCCQSLAKYKPVFLKSIFNVTTLFS